MFEIRYCSENKYCLIAGSECAVAINLPDSPDVDPYNVTVNSVWELDDAFETWIDNFFPRNEYHLHYINFKQSDSEFIQLGQDYVPAEKCKFPIFDINEYYGVGFVEKGRKLNGAVLLAICIPDFFLEAESRGVFMVQIASAPFEKTCVIVPTLSRFCICNHDTFKSGAKTSEVLRDWYVAKGVDEVCAILDAL